jgi:hypothetical protein
MSKNEELLRRLRVVWDNGDDHDVYRYIPKALQPGVNHSWGVWDRKEKRFLKDKQVKKLSFENVCEKYVQ